jgi:hypothetical protein
MASTAQIDLWHADKVATQVTVAAAPNGIRFAAWGETRISDADLERLVGAVPAALSAALAQRAYYFVPLAIADTGETLIAPGYSVDLGDRAICHRNAAFGSTEAVFISTRLVEDRFGLAFEFFINVAHNFVDATGVPESFSSLIWAQAEAQVRGETSQDAWEARRRAQDPAHRDPTHRPDLKLDAKSVRSASGSAAAIAAPIAATGAASGVSGAANAIPASGPMIDERARLAYYEAAFSDAMAVYMLSLAVDFDYRDLREREYPLLDAGALAERLRHVAALFPANPGYEFQIVKRRKN